jgi:outer membrane lipoprotein SlyB
MVKKSSFLILSLAALLFAGCESKTATGALAGGALGAGVGGIAGGGKGALIGGAAGVIAGGLIGAALDDRDARNLNRESPQTYQRVDNGEQLNVTDIINMNRAGIDDDKIIELIQKTSSHFTLNSYQINQLRNAGVSERVINYMMYNT